MLNVDQHHTFDMIFASTSAQDEKLFFLHGPGGTGKMFLYTTLCHQVHANRWIALCIASSGIVALLLPGGCTAHSTFSIPVEMLSEDSTCQIEKHLKHTNMLRKVQLIIWDEAVTQHRYSLTTIHPFSILLTLLFTRHAIEAVDHMLQDIFSTNKSFGGIMVVFGGDFQQTLPVVIRET
jgi:hypothetical protein